MAAVHVAVGVVLDEQRRVLISKRKASAHQGGLWEFPGGKVEARETVPAALARELREELGIDTRSVSPLMEVRHDYGDKQVLLDVWWVNEFSGTARGREGQPLKWVAACDLSQHAFPEANVPILKSVVEQLTGADS